MFGLFKRSKPDPSRLLQELDPENRCSQYHKNLMEMQLTTLEIFKASERKNETLTAAEFLQALLFSRGAMDYLAEYNFQKNDEDGLIDLWAFRQQVMIAEMLDGYHSGDLDKRAALVKFSLGYVEPESKGHKLGARGYEAAHSMHKAMKSGDLGDVGFALTNALKEYAAD